MNDMGQPRSDNTHGEGAHNRSSYCAIWGILNITPDSFSDGGRYLDTARAIEHAERLITEGADVLDVGGESSRPAGLQYGEGFAEVPAAEEIRRVVPVIEHLAKELNAAVSIDTVKPEVADAALRAGALVVNDVSCGRSPELMEVAAAHGAGLVLMHNRGRGECTPPNTVYDDVVADVIAELLTAAEAAQEAGVSRDKTWIDPGIGFAKTAAQSAALIGALPELVETGYRVLVGSSRKSFIGKLAPRPSGEEPGPLDRVGGTAATVAAAVMAGCHAVRVHDVEVMRQAVRTAEAVRARTRGVA